MQILKTHAHKHADTILKAEKPHLLTEIATAVSGIDAVQCLTKETREQSKINKWGGLLFSPRTLNALFRQQLLHPYGWLQWDSSKKRYIEPVIRFQDETTVRGADRYRKMDGIKERVGLEVQMGKYAFMGYDIFSKMIIFKNRGLIDYGVEVVLVQQMIDCMSTGVSAFEHIMIDFRHRGEADIDIPVLVYGVGPTDDEWQRVYHIQQAYKSDPDAAKRQYPFIGQTDLRGSPSGPKPDS